MSLISKQTIKANTVPLVAHDYELTLIFRVNQYERPLDPDLAVALNRIFHAWDEGRHPFNVEMVTAGLRASIKDALYQCCQKRAQEKYGPPMLRASIEAKKEFNELWKAGVFPGFCNQPDIKIERVNDGRAN